MTLLDTLAPVSVPGLSEIISPNHDAEPLQSFAVDSFEKALWAAKKIVEATERMEFRTAKAKAFKTKIDSWLEESNKSDDATRSYLTGLLQPFIESELTRQGKGRTLLLVEFEASLRKQPEKMDITNPEAALKFCETRHPEALVVKKELSKTEVKKLFQSGHLIPGVVLSGGEDKLYLQRH